jgi:hypothetical protein
VIIEADGPDRIVVRRVRRDLDQTLGVFDGIYEPDYLDDLRARERS